MCLFFVTYTSQNACVSSCDNVGVAEHRVSWIQHNADCVLPKELLRDPTEEQSFQCGSHPRILIVSNRAQQISPSLIFDDCFDHQLHSGHCLGVFSGRKLLCVPPLFDILYLHFHAEHQGVESEDRTQRGNAAFVMEGLMLDEHRWLQGSRLCNVK